MALPADPRRNRRGRCAGAPVGQVLSLTGTTELGLAADRWSVGYFKGGSEPGVLSRTLVAGALTLASGV